MSLHTTARNIGSLVSNSKAQQKKTLEKLYCKYFFHIGAILKQRNLTKSVFYFKYCYLKKKEAKIYNRQCQTDLDKPVVPKYDSAPQHK